MVTEMMQAAVMTQQAAPLQIISTEIPRPGSGQILIKLEASGVCHTDVHIWQGGFTAAGQPEPLILGHEGVGTVTAIGPDVTDWKIGDRAGAAWLHNTCGSCSECQDNQESFCQTQRAHGYNVNGTFAEYVIADAKFAAHLPSTGDAAELAPLMCAGLTAYGAIERAKLQSGEICAIFGCGGLGLYAIQLAVRRGATVIAIDNDENKLAIARTLGAQKTLLANKSLEEQWPDEDQAHVCINFAPTPLTWKTMIAAIRPRGRIIAAAMVPEAVGLNQEWLTGSGVTITGTSVGTRAQMAELISLHEQNPLTGEIIKISLSQVNQALLSLQQGTAKGRYCIVL